MKAPFSPYLDAIAPGLKKLVELLGEDYDYVSVLSTDSVGFAVSISQRAKHVDHSTMMTERGSVVRVRRGGLYSEYAFNRFDPARPEVTAAEARRVLDEQFALLEETASEIYDTPALPDEPCELREEMETGELPENCDLGALVESFSEMSARGVASGEHAVDRCLILLRLLPAKDREKHLPHIRIVQIETTPADPAGIHDILHRDRPVSLGRKNLTRFLKDQLLLAIGPLTHSRVPWAASPRTRRSPSSW